MKTFILLSAGKTYFFYGQLTYYNLLISQYGNS